MNCWIKNRIKTGRKIAISKITMDEYGDLPVGYDKMISGIMVHNI